MTPRGTPVWRTDALIDRLREVLTDRAGAPVEVTDLKRFTAGLSWVTISFRMTPQGGPPTDAILRIGDPGGLLAPYSSRPEALTFTRLNAETDVPVPQVLWCSDDPAFFGAPFLIVTRMPGEVLLPRWPGIKHDVPYDSAEPVAEDFARHLAAIHASVWRGTELEELTPGVTSETAIEREIDHWTRHATGPSGRVEDIAMHFAARWMKAHRPPSEEVVLLHGDYRVGNFLVEDGRITGLLDWELTHLGDPDEDLAWAGLRTFGGTDTTLSGLLDRRRFYDCYEEASGRRVDPARIQYFEVLAQFKMAAMLIGAEHRLRAGNVHDIRLAVMALQKPATLMGMTKMIEHAS